MNKIFAKKSLGQNFLSSKKIVERIVMEAKVSKEDCVLEIGPGKGILTEALLEKVKKVIAVEKDDFLFEFLKEKFAKEIKVKKLEIIHEDIVDFDQEKIKKPYKLVANIPYNITGEILRKFLSGKNKPESMTVLVQKEVAERIFARDGKESLLSISVKIFGTPRLGFVISRGQFNPVPNVDSRVLSIDNINEVSKKFEALGARRRESEDVFQQKKHPYSNFFEPSEYFFKNRPNWFCPQAKIFNKKFGKSYSERKTSRNFCGSKNFGSS